MNSTRQFHARIRTRIELALGARSWSWLSRTAGVPQSTLASQSAKPKFSVDVLLRIAMALEKDVTYFLPVSGDGRSPTTDVEDVLTQIDDLIQHLRDGTNA